MAKKRLLVLVLIAFIVGICQCLVYAQTDVIVKATPAQTAIAVKRANARMAANMRSTTQAMRIAAANRRLKALAAGTLKAPQLAPVPGGQPDYFNYPNWALSPLPVVGPGGITGGIRKFVNTLPGVGFANRNNLDQYIPIANKISNPLFPNDDYYELAVVEYQQQVHTDLPATTFRGYKDMAPTADGSAHYLGPLIIAKRDKPVRIKFSNLLPTGLAGNLFIPVDTTAMGAGTGPLGGTELYTQNRANLHLHGGATPWISDGTPHQWITPATETTSYPKGVSFMNVPDMPDPGNGSATYFYSNQQSSRLMFYHDHSYGITRLNVYAGEAAGYLVTDPAEDNLIDTNKIPGAGQVEYRYGIPLVIQDKTFVPPTDQLAAEDPTWNWGPYGGLWFPHVYMVNQNPYDDSGANPFGRWDYGPWFWPVFNMITNGPVETFPGSGIFIPGTPNPSLVPEAFMDTPLVNGTPYPTLTVARKAYRFRILNASNDRFWNLSLFKADPANPTEVLMVPAVKTVGYPASWPTDGRDGGVPDFTTSGPDMIQIGTEAGLLTAPVVIHPQPVNYNYNRRDIVVLNVADHGLFLGPAERADVIVDFSQIPDGTKIILYNDAPAPVPAFDPRIDYYTGDPDQTTTGGAPTTLVGYGPNTRTIMQFVVSGATADPAFDLAGLNTALPVAYAASQDKPIVPEAAYNTAFGTTDPNKYARIQDTSMTFTPSGTATPITMPLRPKAIQELFELDYGRMNATLGVEVPNTTSVNQTTIPLGYIDPATEIMKHNEAQLWKITHNGVDTHAIHFHLFNVQVVNRVGWDGAIRPPDANELGWKETVKMNPLEDIIVAMKPIAPVLPFAIPDSQRLMDVTRPAGSTMGFWNQDANGNPVTTVNAVVNYGWEYVWHCHLLGHEENDMMRPIVFGVPPQPPTNLTAVAANASTVNLAWKDNSITETGFTLQRADNNLFTLNVSSFNIGANKISYSDLSTLPLHTYYYRILAYNGNGVSAWSNTATVTTPDAPVVAPSNLTATVINSNQINLAWKDNANNEKNFEVQRATNAGFTLNVTRFTGLPANTISFPDTSVSPATAYWYRVRCSNSTSTSAWSNVATGVTPGLTIPNAPSGFTAVAGASGHITLNWTDNSNNETYFEIMRATNSGFTVNRIRITTAANVITLDNTPVTTGVTYFYRIRSGNAVGVSAWSPAAAPYPSVVAP